MALAIVPIGAQEPAVHPNFAAAEASWPGWRGPLSTGVAPNGDPPVHWSETENIRWKVETGVGAATPVVWGSLVLVLTARPSIIDSEILPWEVPEFPPFGMASAFPTPTIGIAVQFAITALARRDGAVVWEQTVSAPMRYVEIEASNPSEFRTRLPSELREWYRSFVGTGALVTDGEVVCALVPGMEQRPSRVSVRARRAENPYGACYDMDGHLLWSDSLPLGLVGGYVRNDGLALYEDVVVAASGSDVIVLDKRTGLRRWGGSEDSGDDRRVTGTNQALLVVAHAGRVQVVTSGDYVRAQDLETGELVWRILDGVGPALTPVSRGGVAYVTTNHLGNRLYAVDLSVARDKTICSGVRAFVNCSAGFGAVRWWWSELDEYWARGLRRRQVEIMNARGAAPVMHDGVLYVQNARGRLFAYDATTGGRLYGPVRVPVRVWGGTSPVVAGDRLYIGMLVAKTGTTFQRMASNSLDDPLVVSPAVAEGELYFQGRQYLYCIAAG